jgi:hypothetical protein
MRRLSNIDIERPKRLLLETSWLSVSLALIVTDVVNKTSTPSDI